MNEETLDGFRTKLIHEGELEVEGRFVDASNATLFARVSIGEDSLPVIYKPIAGERPLWDFPDGTLAAREVAAYTFSEALDLNLIPYTILRDGPFGMGSVQEWIEVPETVDIVELVRSKPEQLRTLALLDAIMNNTDRKFGHILVNSEGSIFGCDHGLCFHEDDKLRTVLWNWSGVAFSDGEIQLLDKASEAVHLLEEYISAAEIDALSQRIGRLRKDGTFPEPSELWPPVPFPPY